MEDRKSVLETTKPSDALGRLAERRSHSRTLMLTVAAVIVLGLIFLVASIIHTATRGAQDIRVPSVIN